MKTSLLTKTAIFLFVSSQVTLACGENERRAEREAEEEMLEEITVNSRGIDENLLDSPMSISIIDATTAEQQGYQDVQSAISTKAGVDVHSAGDVGYNSMWIRGTGALTHTSSDDNSVDVRVDGVSNSMLGLSRTLMDIKQIEIAKGPQGTLYGQSAEAGVITINTNDPTPELEGYIGAGLASDSFFSQEAMINVPLSEQFFLRVAVKNVSEDHYVLSSESGKPINKQSRQAIQAKLRWTNNANTDAIVSAYYDSRDNHLPLFVTDSKNPPPKMRVGNLTHEAKRKSDGVSLKVTHDFDNATLTSISAYHHHDGYFIRPFRPLDTLPNLYAVMKIPEPMKPVLNKYFNDDKNNSQRPDDNIDQFSQEFKLSSAEDADIKWVAGLYLLNKERQFSYDGRRELLKGPTGKPLLPPDVSNAVFKRRYKHSSQAIFGEVTAPVSKKLNIIGGLRLSHDSLDYDVEWTPNASGQLASKGKQVDNQSLSETYLTGRTGLRYDISDSFRLYSLYSRGHKAGGFADYSTNIALGKKDKPYKSAEIDAIEIGMKYQNEDDTLRFSAAVYQNRIKNDHVTIVEYPSYATDTRNVDTKSKGVEFEGLVRPNDNWQINGAFAYTDSKVTQASKDADTITQEGNRMPQVPKISANIGVEYSDDLSIMGGGQWFLGMNARYVGERPAQPDNKDMLDAYMLLDAHVGIETDYGELRLWGKNLTDEKWRHYSVLGGGQVYGMPADGTTFGVNYKYHF